MPRKKTHEEFVKQIYDLVEEEYTVLGKYESDKISLEIRHNDKKCNFHTYNVRPSNFIQGTRCSQCYGNKKRDTEVFKKEVLDLVGDEYLVLGEYKTTNTKIKMKHNACNFAYEVQPSAFLQGGTRCPQCAGRGKRTTDDYKNTLYQLVGNEYELLGGYKNSHMHVTLKHNICDNTYQVLPSNFYKGTRCPYCYGNKKKDTEIFKNEVFELVGNEYSVLSEYINTDTRINMKHISCGHEYEVRPNDFLRGKRCPRCNSSKGELAIEKWLITNNIIYKPQYKFKDCVNIRPLSFDFALFNNKSELTHLIEFDGEQHYKPIEYFGGEENFQTTIKHDKIKNNYSRENKIRLIRIPFWHYENIEEILEKLINNQPIEVDETSFLIPII
jgi:hypothetical protein